MTRLEALPGDWILDYIRRAMEAAPVECEFNGAKFSVLPGETEKANESGGVLNPALLNIG